MEVENQVKSLMALLPSPRAVKSHALDLVAVLIMSVFLFPLVKRLPTVGWDWYFVFYGPERRLSAYPPFSQYFFDLLTWMNWRDSLALVGSISLVSVALTTRRRGGGIGSMTLALLSAPTWYLLWIGHPDGLVLFGVLTGLFPLALIKPQISIWYYLKDWRWTIAVAVFILLTLIAWPLWIRNFEQATFYLPAAFGWRKAGWPVALLGVAFLAGAGKDGDRLMAAGTLLSPYLMPYHLVLLVPILGRARRGWKVLLFFASWLGLLGVGVAGAGNLFSYTFPIMCYLSIQTRDAYSRNLHATAQMIPDGVRRWKKWRNLPGREEL
jgi:hypothetical protein